MPLQLSHWDWLLWMVFFFFFFWMVSFYPLLEWYTEPNPWAEPVKALTKVTKGKRGLYSCPSQDLEGVGHPTEQVLQKRCTMDLARSSFSTGCTLERIHILKFQGKTREENPGDENYFPLVENITQCHRDSCKDNLLCFAGNQP